MSYDLQIKLLVEQKSFFLLVTFIAYNYSTNYFNVMLNKIKINLELYDENWVSVVFSSLVFHCWCSDSLGGSVGRASVS